MTQEEKNLLLKDLCARLPYGVNVDIKHSKENGSSLRHQVCSEGMLQINTDLLGLFQEEEIHLKPYLRPLSGMTEEEKKEYKHLVAFSGNPTGSSDFLDWLNAHHFDYRGLIEKCLALKAPEGMYKTK